MTVYELNNLTLNPLVIYTMCEDEKICVFSQLGRNRKLPELFEECTVQEVWCENNLIAVRI